MSYLTDYLNDPHPTLAETSAHLDKITRADLTPHFVSWPAFGTDETALVARLDARIAYLEASLKMAAVIADGDIAGPAIYTLARRAVGDFDLDDPIALSEAPAR